VIPKTYLLGQLARAGEYVCLIKLETTFKLHDVTFDIYYRCDIAVLEKVARLKV